MANLRAAWAIVLFASLLLIGCESRESRRVTEGPPVSAPPPATESMVEPTPTRGLPVEIPAEVRDAWSAVKISVIDKEAGNEILYTVPIGGEAPVADSDLSIDVEAFIPAFVMSGTALTSTSNKLENPAALIVVHDGGEEVFRGWIFSLYPAAHAFQHPRFSFVLADFVPSKK